MNVLFSFSPLFSYLISKRNFSISFPPSSFLLFVFYFRSKCVIVSVYRRLTGDQMCNITFSCQFFVFVYFVDFVSFRSVLNVCVLASWLLGCKHNSNDFIRVSIKCRYVWVFSFLLFLLLFSLISLSKERKKKTFRLHSTHM